MKRFSKMQFIRPYILNSALALFLLFLFGCTDIDGDLSSLNALKLVTVENHPEIYSEIDEQDKTVELLIPFHSVLPIDKVKLRLRISPDASTNIDSSVEYDLSEPLIIDVVAEDKTTSSYLLRAKKCEGGNSAVIVSDTQNDVLPLYRQESFFTNANIVLDKAFEAEVPIYYVMLTSLKGTPDWDLPGLLHYYDNGEMVDKGDYMDSFEETILHKEFLKKGINKVYVIGVSSLGCVLGTCKGAAIRKYELTLISNAHSEPIGFRVESSIDECNDRVLRESLGQLVEAVDLEF